MGAEIDRRVKLVCFDLGCVLVRVRGTWAEACAAAGVPVPAVALDPQRSDELTAIYKPAETGAVDTETFAARTARYTGLTVDQVMRVSDAWLGGAYPGARELVESVTNTGVKTACLSNTNANHWRLLMTPGNEHDVALGRLTYRFASHLMGCAKPDAAAYERVERDTGVAPEDVLFFDDLPANCRAAAQRGWQVIRVDPTNNPIGQMRGCLRERGILQV